MGTGGSVTTTTLALTSAVHAGDLLVGWFGQYNSTGQVQVSDNVNGAWTRGASETVVKLGRSGALLRAELPLPHPAA